ncbi:hypothetical protein JCM5350_007595 [Sporobolomyces pararoseus]
MDKPKRNKTKQISYIEVDSDIDLPSDEERKFEDQIDSKGNKRGRRVKEDESDVEDTTGTTTTKKKQDKSTTRKKKHKYNSKMLLELPFDIFAELCTHLDYKDLINLAKVNKSLHKILLCRAARPIFAGIRKRDGFPLPQDMSELGFAILLVEGWFTAKTLNSARRARFLITDLSDVNAELLDAQAEDEIEEMAWETRQRRKSSSRRRNVPAEPAGMEVESPERTSRVDAYVEEKREQVKKEQGTALTIGAVENKLKKEIEKREQDVWQQTVEERRQLFIDYALELEDLGWSEDDIDDLFLPFVRKSLNPPKVSPSADLEQWSQYLRRINVSRRDFRSSRKLEKSLDPFYQSLHLTESPLHSGIFPTLSEFQTFKAIKSWLEDKNPEPFTKSLWLKLLPSILDELAKYYKAIRIEAIRSILSAQQGIHITKVSKSPSAYSESLYPDSFFNLATSLFPPRRNRKFKALSSYPEVATNGSGTWKGKGTLGRRAEPRTTFTIQAIIEAAGLDKSTATAEDLDALGRRFTWDNDAREGSRDTLRTWRELVEAVRERGSNDAKYKDGTATTIVSYFPQVDVDGTTYLDDEGEGPGDIADNSDEEEEEEEGEGKSIHRGGNDSEEDNGGEDSQNSNEISEEEDRRGSKD